jgi:type IV secretion system protein VirD4
MMHAPLPLWIALALLPWIAGVAIRLRKGRNGKAGGWSLRRAHKAGKPLPATIRSSNDNHGHAHWLPIAEAARRWSHRDPEYGGVVIGEAYEPAKDPVHHLPFDPADPATWGRGGKAPLLIDDCHIGSTHSLVIAGSGYYKTVCLASTLVEWKGPVVVMDPAQELGPMLLEARRRLGHRVLILDPDGDTGFNALDWIDIGKRSAETDISSMAQKITGYPRHDSRDDATSELFGTLGKDLVKCLLAHMLWDGTIAGDLKTLRTLRVLVEQPIAKMRRMLANIHRYSESRIARSLAGTMVGMDGEQFSGVYMNATNRTSWLADMANADLVSGDSFRSADLCAGETDVFIAVPLKTILASPEIVRVIIEALMNAVYEAKGAIRNRVLFAIDEAFYLGDMKILTLVRDGLRKYGITLHLLYQSVGQIEEIWGLSGKRAWYEGVSWRSYAAVGDDKTAEELAGIMTGQYGALAWSQGENAGRSGRPMEVGSRSTGETTTFHDIRRPLIFGDEILYDLRDDEQILVSRVRPLRCGRAIYFRRKEYADLVARSRFVRERADVRS